MNNRLALFTGSEPQKSLDAGFHGLSEAKPSTLLEFDTLLYTYLMINSWIVSNSRLNQP